MSTLRPNRNHRQAIERDARRVLTGVVAALGLGAVTASESMLLAVVGVALLAWAALRVTEEES